MRWDYLPLDINPIFPGLGEIEIIIIIIIIIIKMDCRNEMCCHCRW